MKKILILAACLIMLTGCATTSEKDKIIEKGTFMEKLVYLEDNPSGKDDVLEMLGPPKSVKNFNDYCTVWSYAVEGEKPVDILFGREGSILRIEFKSKTDY